MDLRCLRLVC